MKNLLFVPGVSIVETEDERHSGRLNYEINGPSEAEVIKAIQLIQSGKNVGGYHFFEPTCIGRGQYMSSGFVKQRLFLVG